MMDRIYYHTRSEEEGLCVEAWDLEPGKFFVNTTDLHEILQDYQRLCELEQSLPI